MKIKTELKNIEKGKGTFAVKITHAGCTAINRVHFEAIIRAMHDVDEKAFDMAMMTCIPGFIGGQR